MHEIIVVEHLNAFFGRAPVLEDISFSVIKGDYIGLAGPNGAGKTTLIKMLMGLAGFESGSVYILGKNIKDFREWSRIGYLPQKIYAYNPLFPATVHEVVGMGLLSQKKYPKKFTREDKEKIRSALDLLDIRHLENKLFSALSGGEQQRMFLARALVSLPEILFLDEPSTALDPKIREDFYELIKKLNAERGITIMLVTHDVGNVGQYANKLLYLDKKIIFYGAFPDFCSSPDMSHYFGYHEQHLICHQHGTFPPVIKGKS